jgi:hypothetical protein
MSLTYVVVDDDLKLSEFIEIVDLQCANTTELLKYLYYFLLILERQAVSELMNDSVTVIVLVIVA